MALAEEFRRMVMQLSAHVVLPAIADVFLPPFCRGGQPKDAEFMAIMLEGGAVGVSYVLLPDDLEQAYTALTPSAFIGTSPVPYALAFGSSEPVRRMVSLAALNAICQHIMKQTDFPLDTATDSLGRSDVSRGDTVGMVGFFPSLVKAVQKVGADLVVIEKKSELIAKHPDVRVTLDPDELRACNKVLCTSMTVFNNTLDDIMSRCSPDASVSVIGPTAGYFPDPLFQRGVAVVGGTFITDGELFLRLIARGQRWGPATQKFCFQRQRYPGLPFSPAA